MSKLSCVGAALLGAAFVVAATVPSRATTMTSAVLETDMVVGTDFSGPASGFASSEVIDSPGFLARASADPLANSLRNEIRTPASSSTIPRASANASIDDSWSCATGCGPTVDGLSVAFTFHISGTATPIGNFGELIASYTLQVDGFDAAQFNFSYSQDGDNPRVSAFFIGETPATPPMTGTMSGATPLPVSVTVDPTTGNFDILLSTTITGIICAPPQGCSTTGTAFTDVMQMRSRLTASGGAPTFIDAFNTFTVEMELLDPGLSFVSDEGRTLRSASAPPAAMSEPSQLLLFGAGLASLAWLRRRRKA